MARRAGGGCCGFGDPRSWGTGDFGTAWGLVGGDYCERQAGLG